MARAPKGGDEEDALTRARRYYRWRPGELRRIKRQANRRDRREGKREVTGVKGVGGND